MSDYTIEDFEHAGYRILIKPDDCLHDTPRDWDNLGTMMCAHSRYNLGDEQGDKEAFLQEVLTGEQQEYFERKEERLDAELYERQKDLDDYWCRSAREDRWEIADQIENEKLEAAYQNAVVLPLYLYDHSGITMSTNPFGCHWDSGQVGFIYVMREDILKEFDRKRLTKKLRKRVEEILIAEVECYDQYLRGDVYGFQITPLDDEDDVLDSCWGFYGLDDCIEEAKSTAERLGD